MSEQESTIFPLIPLKEVVIFPFSITPLYVMPKQSLAALEAAMEADKRVFVLTQRSAQTENPGPDDLYEFGVAAEIIQLIRLPDGSAKVLVEGHYIGRVLEYVEDEQFAVVRVVPQTVYEDRSKKVRALERTVIKQFEHYVSLNDRIPEEALAGLRESEDGLHIAHSVANYAVFHTEQKQSILEADSISEKLMLISRLLDEETEMLTLENKIMSQVRNSITSSQKEYFLNEQLRVIEKELGLTSDDDFELDELQDAIESLAMSPEARDRAEKELGRLSRMQPMSPEATVARGYIEWLLDLPWGKATKDKTDLVRAQKVLDTDHYGLDEPKERIIEHLAVHSLVEEMKGPILCFVGPPGVGKTSLARSVARALGRKFVRVSLGGVRDEAEIRGHRRTYIGSLPGKIVQSMKKAGSINPVFLMDEIDKMSTDFRGDPSSALLEVLDPEQNKTFNDHYLEIDYDLSRAMFITTANTTDGIPWALRDRMEIIRLPGYTEDEKCVIAQQFLIPKQVKAHGLTRRLLAVPEKALRSIITGYTREAGVRELERQVAKICRKSAKSLIETKAAGKKRKRDTVTAEKVREYLGVQKFHDQEILHQEELVGVANGLAWTEVGGELLPTEAMTMRGRGKLTLTGKLGDVMQESAKAALSYIRARADEFNIKPDFYKNTDIHVHIPEGAIPKDGPSAGVTMMTAMISALNGRPVRQDVVMTGEITLRGKVLKIGGLKEKVLAAHRAHIRRVIIPKDNADDLDKLAGPIREAMEFIEVDHIDQVLEAALVKTDERKRSTTTRRRRRSAQPPARA
ncbi:endopeptidase La [Candidatus Sumerlaeota bacterium]